MSAFEHLNHGLSFQVASAVSAKKAVGLSASQVGYVVPVIANTVEPIGVTISAASAVGDPVAVYHGAAGNVVKAVAAASLGHGADVGIASNNGDLGPVAAASGAARFRVGKSLQAAAAGETFSVYVDPARLPDNT